MVSNKLKIGLLGTDFSSGNLGCAALGYGFIHILDEVLQSHNIKATVTVFDRIDINALPELAIPHNISLDKVDLKGNRTHRQRKIQQNLFKDFTFIIDFTAGDSFSDLYGMKRFVSRSLVKLNVIHAKTRLVMGNQTYGPFHNIFAKIFAKYIVRHSYCSFSRDGISEKYVKENFNYVLKQAIDVAFALPYKILNNHLEKKKIGINVSGLLWSGGYTKGNQFKLKFSYKKYIITIIKRILKDENNEIFLIPHVISSDMAYPDNDLTACEEIIKVFPHIKKYPHFNNPIEAKSFIAGMDLVLGARMHATIAAFSSGVAVIPFAYSRKFQGIFHDFGYSYVIDGCHMEFEEAVSKTMQYIKNIRLLKSKVNNAEGIIDNRLKIYKNDLAELIMG